MTALPYTRNESAPPVSAPSLSDLRRRLDIPQGDAVVLADHLPFAAGDTTCGVENELQAVVIGNASDTDLPRMIRESNYFRNVLRRSRSGDVSSRQIQAIEAFLSENDTGVWENAWVRFPQSVLSPYALHVFSQDLRADKSDPDAPQRRDSNRFRFRRSGEDWIRIPVSYLIKLALADIIGISRGVHPAVRVTGRQLLSHFLNDNTSPETTSFHPGLLGCGKRTADPIVGETRKRYLLTQLLVRFANRKFRLAENGQRAEVYFASHPPVRQKQLNDIISDSFYRELFMSPCLSGWDKGEEKHQYMGLCHEVLSRSQLNGVKKLQESGIINSNLIVLPNTSNVSLANNGTHISIGSRKLTRLLKNPDAALTANDEKWAGDLVIKIMEHFLPLMVNTFSGAPYRLDFADFHPEKVLGFLPHELDFTHLRMLWRRWRKKAKNRVLTTPITPFGPPMIDGLLSKTFGLKGDLVPDFRLLDYPAALMSTTASPALNGQIGNQERLLQDLSDLGIFDTRMSLYLLYRMRACSQMGFSGFEGRHYSTFPHLGLDMGGAARFQTLVTALAWLYIIEGRYTHGDIPDTPFVESERRQIFFATAIDLPTVYLHAKTKNRLVQEILSLAQNTRSSRRYPGFIRVPLREWHLALMQKIRTDAPLLIENHGAQDLMEDLTHRLHTPADRAADRLVNAITAELGLRSAADIPARTFNTKAEHYYRNTGKEKHIKESVAGLILDLERMENWARFRDTAARDALSSLIGDESPAAFVSRRQSAIFDDTLENGDLITLIRILILAIDTDRKQAGETV